MKEFEDKRTIQMDEEKEVSLVGQNEGTAVGDKIVGGINWCGSRTRIEIRRRGGGRRIRRRNCRGGDQ